MSREQAEAAQAEKTKVATAAREKMIAANDGKPFKVRATRAGYIYHMRRREGDVFMLTTVKTSDGKGIIKPIEQFSDKWMERVDPETPPAYSTSQSEINRRHDETHAERQADRNPANAGATGVDALAYKQPGDPRVDRADDHENQGGNPTGDAEVI